MKVQNSRGKWPWGKIENLNGRDNIIDMSLLVFQNAGKGERIPEFPNTWGEKRGIKFQCHL